MRLRIFFSESWRNIASGTSRAVAFMLAVMVCALLGGGYDLITVLGQEQNAATRIGALADGVNITGQDNIDGAACDSLATVSHGPYAAGSMRDGTAVTPLAAPGKSLTRYQVSPGMITLIAGSETPVQRADTSGIWLSRDLATTLGVLPGSDMPTDVGVMHVAGIFAWPNDGRDTRFAYAIIEPVSVSGVFNECWARQWPSSDQTESLLFSTLIIANVDEASTNMSAAAATRAINANYGQGYDALALYRGRITHWMPLVGCAAGMLIGILSVRRRRLEYAGALHCGQRKADLLSVLGVETGVWAGVGALAAGCVLSVVALRWANDSAITVLLGVIRTPAAVFGGVLLGALIAGGCIRERYLFRYFKNR